MNVQSPGRPIGVNVGVIVGGIVGGNFSDPTNERIILLSAVGLVLVGGGLLVGTIVWWRRGREENPVLAPLEVMGGRSWAKASTTERRRQLDEVRVAGAGGASDQVASADPVDLEELMRSDPQAFDDLREPSGVVEVVEAAEMAEVAAQGDGPAEVVETAEPPPAAAAEVVDVGTAAAPADGEVAENATKPKPTTRSKSTSKAAGAPAVAGEVAVVTSVEVGVSTESAEAADPDATSFSAERPSDDDLAPTSSGKISASARNGGQAHTSTAATANRGAAASKSPSADPLL